MLEAASWRRVIVGLTVVGCLLGAAGSKPATGQELPYKVIVHPELTGASIRRGALSDIFLRKGLRWGDGTSVQPVDQSTQSAVREAFSQHVHGQPVAAVMKFWMRQISDGRGVPPPVKGSDEEVIAYVASRRGAVGYVSARAPVPGTVRVLQVVE